MFIYFQGLTMELKFLAFDASLFDRFDLISKKKKRNTNTNDNRWMNTD